MLSVKVAERLVPALLQRFWSNQTMRDIILLQCTECKSKNYATRKNKKNTTEKILMKKYCKFERRHTDHKETKS